MSKNKSNVTWQHPHNAFIICTNNKTMPDELVNCLLQVQFVGPYTKTLMIGWSFN